MALLEVFLDETYPRGTQADHLRVAAVAFYKSHLRRSVSELSGIRSGPSKEKLTRVRDFLIDRSVLNLIGEVDMIGTEYSSSGRDSFTDVGAISRRNNYWSQIIAFSAAAVVRVAIDRGVKFEFVRVFYDPKSLGRDHKAELHTTLARIVRKLTWRRYKRRVDLCSICEVGKSSPN